MTIAGPISGIRGSQHSSYVQFKKIEARRRFFTNRIVNEWNKLDNYVVTAETLNGLKRRFDKITSQRNDWTLVCHNRIPMVILLRCLLIIQSKNRGLIIIFY